MNQIEVVLYDPHEKQRILHNYCDLSSPNFWTICVSGRQAGKSWAGQNQANGSKIEFKSAESKSLRGNTVHYLIIDEAAYIKEERIENEIMGTLNQPAE